MTTESTEAHAAADPESEVAAAAAAADAAPTQNTPKMKARKPNHRFGIPETQPEIVQYVGPTFPSSDAALVLVALQKSVDFVVRK
jgi:hypothetical protein